MSVRDGIGRLPRGCRAAALVLAVLAPPAVAQTQADPETASGATPTPLALGERFMIVAAHPFAATTGSEILQAGGSAVDAAIATLLVLNVVEPQSSGIGGGGFALVAGPDGVTSFDARETAPAAATPDMFIEEGEPLPFLTAVASGDSVGVPGLVRLIETLHKRYGKLPWGALFEPAIELAEEGFEVSPRLADAVAASVDRLVASDAGAVFAPGSVALVQGDTLRQPALARSLRAIAEKGPGTFYEGPMAEAIVHSVTRGPREGAMEEEDLAGYRVIERPAVCHPFVDYRVCGMGPPSSGATTVGQMLMLMERAGLGTEAGAPAADDPRLWHLFAEASRLAYADRARYLADPDFVDVPVRGLLDPDYLAERARLIPADKASEGAAAAGEPPFREGRRHAPGPPQDRPGTTHLSVIDGEGLAVSITASIETAFGSGRMAEGFLLNNQLTDFSFLPAAEDGTPIANAVAPGKRPRSSMAPTIVFQEGERPAVLTGSPGGSRIPEYVAQNLIAMLVLGLDPVAAAALPHVSQRNLGEVTLEPGTLPAIAEGLRAMGHKTAEADMNSGVHTIRVLPDGTLQGGADPRREGVGVGH